VVDFEPPLRSCVAKQGILTVDQTQPDKLISHKSLAGLWNNKDWMQKFPTPAPPSQHPSAAQSRRAKPQMNAELAVHYPGVYHSPSDLSLINHFNRLRVF